MLIEVDPVELVRKPGGPSGEGGLLDQYVNDRPYVSSSFTSVALARASWLRTDRHSLFSRRTVSGMGREPLLECQSLSEKTPAGRSTASLCLIAGPRR